MVLGLLRSTALKKNASFKNNSGYGSRYKVSLKVVCYFITYVFNVICEKLEIVGVNRIPKSRFEIIYKGTLVTEL